MKKMIMLLPLLMTLTATAQVKESLYGVLCGHSDVTLKNKKTVRLWADKGLIIRDENTGSVVLKESKLEITRSKVSGKNYGAVNEEGVVPVLNFSSYFGNSFLITIEMPYNSQVVPKKIQLSDGSIKKLKTAQFNCTVFPIKSTPL